VWNWVMQAAAVMNRVPQQWPAATWTPPPMPMVDPAREGPALRDLARSGARTMPDIIREQGFDPDEHLAEIAAWNKKLDDLGITLDSDPRKTSAAGLTQARPKGTVNPDPSAYDDSDEEAAAAARAVVRPFGARR
jgi:capsid protein